MQVLQDILITIIASYLAFTNAVADHIINLLPAEEVVEQTETVVDEPSPIAQLGELPSRITAIPDILLKSAAYQEAAGFRSVGIRPRAGIRLAY